MPDNLSDHELGALAREVARQTDPPPFSDLVRRARRRRRTHLVATATAAAVVLGGIGLGLGLTQTDGARRGADPVDRRPAPTRETDPPEPDAVVEVHALLADPRTRLLDLAVGPGGDVLAIYRRCAQGCRSAYVLRAGDGGTDAAVFPRRQEPYDAYPLQDGFLVEGAGVGAGLVLRAPGSNEPTVLPPGSRVRAGDFGLVHRFEPWIGQADAEGEVSLFRAPTPRADYVSDAVAVDDQGKLYLFSGDRLPRGQSVRLSSRNAGGDRWVDREMDSGPTAIPGRILVNGPHVVALSTYDGATIAPVGTLLLSNDHGRTWTELHRRDLPFKDVATLAVTSDGAVFAGDEGSGALWRGTTDAGGFDRIPLPGGAQGIVDVLASGPDIYVVTYHEDDGEEVLVSRDSGVSWQPVDLPSP